MNKQSFYITTTLPYVNDKPHMGHALEFAQADILARYRDILGVDVFFNTGTDEHGLKIFRKAMEEGRDPQHYTDEYAEKFRALAAALDLDHDLLRFVRTTDARHVAAAQEFWKRCEKDIYKKKYKGLYCVGDEAFIKETDLVNGKCANHPTMDPIEIEEENYFFALSKYQEKLVEYLSREDVACPQWRRQEALNFVKKGLEDFSISREKSRLPWGIPVPGDDSQVMYVWFDALVNYVSTLGWPDDVEGNFKKFWEQGETVQLAGKDQVRFQSVMWQAMLMSAGIKTTDKVLYHGFITSGGQKMSKSIGNVIDPLEIIGEYGPDALRYFLARHIHPFEDSDFTLARFKEAYNADLANGLGNLVARVMQLAQTHLSAPVELPTLSFPEEYSRSLDAFEFNKALDFATEQIQALDQKINTTEPFKLVKTNPEEGKKIIAELVVGLAGILYMLWPVIPTKGEIIWQAIKENKKPENLFPRKE